VRDTSLFLDLENASQWHFSMGPTSDRRLVDAQLFSEVSQAKVLVLKEGNEKRIFFHTAIVAQLATLSKPNPGI
jgi:hypothetical protein